MLECVHIYGLTHIQVNVYLVMWFVPLIEEQISESVSKQVNKNYEEDNNNVAGENNEDITDEQVVSLQSGEFTCYFVHGSWRQHRRTEWQTSAQ